jgi:hypothetical protein
MRQLRKEDKVQEVVVKFVKWGKLLHSRFRVFPTGQDAGALTTHHRRACNGILRADFYLITCCL